MNGEDGRTCPSCGNELSGAMEFCPVCMLRKVFDAGLNPASLLWSMRASRNRNRQRNALSIMSW